MQEVNNKETNPYVLATWWKRLIGVLIDTLIWMFTVSAIGNGLKIEPPYSEFFLLSFFIAYYLLQEGIFNTTIGKLATGTFLINGITYNKPSFGQVVGRTFSRLIPFDPFSFISRKPIGWHDSISKTMVVNKKSKSVIIEQKSENYNTPPLKENVFKEKRTFINLKKIIIKIPINRLKKIHIGVLILIIIGSIAIPLTVSMLSDYYEYANKQTAFLLYFIVTLLIFWIILFVFLWIYKRFFEIKNINKGVYRLIITGSILTPLIVSILLNYNGHNNKWTSFLIYLVISALFYWIFVFVGFWIYNGFKENKDEVS